jgi:hypothetical protein
VNMVFHRIDNHRRTFQLLEHTRHIGMERFPYCIVQDRRTVFGTENEVDVKTGERLWHGFRSPFQGYRVFRVTQGVALGWG